MNREIKFRAFFNGVKFPIDKEDLYDYEKPQMIYDVHKLYDGSGVKENSVLGGFSCFNSVLQDSDFSVNQFTGLHDINGKEIYEGDILKTSNNIVSVFFGKHISYVTMLGKKDTIETNGWLVKNAKVHIDVLDESFCNGEVIGNIYENPELLDGSVVA